MNSIQRFQKLIDPEPKPATIIMVGVGRGDDLPTWKKLYPDARVIGVEPLKEHRKKLKKAWLWDRKDLYCEALAGQQGIRTLHCNYEPDQRATFYPLMDPLDGEHTQEVRTITLDQLRNETQPWGCPVMLWMDCEGAEAEILDGINDPNTLNNVRWINCEVCFHNCRPEACLHDDVDKILQGFGYKLFAMHSLPTNARRADAIYLTEKEWHDWAQRVMDMQQKRKLRRLERRRRLANPTRR